jgi:hypothetical protein
LCYDTSTSSPGITNRFISGEFNNIFLLVGKGDSLVPLGKNKYKLLDTSSSHLFNCEHGSVLLIVQAGPNPNRGSLPVINDNDARIELNFNLMDLELIRECVSELSDIFEMFISEVEDFQYENEKFNKKNKKLWIIQFNKDVIKKANLSIKGDSGLIKMVDTEFFYDGIRLETPKVNTKTIVDGSWINALSSSFALPDYLHTVETKGGPPWIDLEKFMGGKFTETDIGVYELTTHHPREITYREITISYDIDSIEVTQPSRYISLRVSCLFNDSDCYLSKSEYKDFVNAVASVFTRSQKVATFLNNQPTKKTNADW